MPGVRRQSDARKFWWDATARRFVEWQPYTNPQTGQRGRKSEGGLVRYVGQPLPSQGGSEKPDPSHSLDGLADKLPPEAKTPGTWEKVKAAAVKVHETVYGFMVRMTPTVAAILPEVLDVPSDFGKIGFNPGFAGTGPRVHDPVAAATGISAHVAAAIASHVLAKAIVYTKRRLAGRTSMADANITEAAVYLSQLYDAIGQSLGIDIPHDPKDIEAALSTNVTMAEWQPYTNPDDGRTGYKSAGGQIRYGSRPPDSTDKTDHVKTASTSEVDSVVKSGGVELFRGIADPKAAEAFRRGQDFVGQGDYGNGRYFATSTYIPEGHAGDTGEVVRAALKPDAKSVKFDVIDQQHTNAVRDGTIPATVNVGDYARSLGYDAMIVPHKGYVVVVNPDAIVVQRDKHADEKFRDSSVKQMDDNSAQMGGATHPDTAVAGSDGKALQTLVSDSQDHGVRVMWGLVRDALKRYRGQGPLLNETELNRLAESLAAVRATGELMGRTRVRERASGDLSTKMSDSALKTFADNPPGVIATPQAALDYFQSLAPTLSVDPVRFIGEQRRRAFTLAASTNDVLTGKVHSLIAEGLKESLSLSDVVARIDKQLESFGANPRNPQYAEMVYRTNAVDAYQTGIYEEMTHPDIAGVFPVWQYIGIDDERAGADHRPKFNRFYPSSVSFADVRGDRPFNCRCSLRPVDYVEWQELLRRGARIETRW